MGHIAQFRVLNPHQLPFNLSERNTDLIDSISLLIELTGYT